MPLFDAEDSLIVRQEDRNARATAGRLDFLFRDSDKDTIARLCSRLVAQARDYFASRCRSHRGANIGAPAFHDLIQETTLNWMYFYVNNRRRVQILDADWEHPQTGRIIQAVVERDFQPASVEAVQLCAHLMGVSQEEYLNWREGDQWLLSIW